MKLRHLFEGRDAPLYHTTGLGSAIMIIKKDEIRAVTEHFKDKLTVGKIMDETPIKGVSLTRDIRFGFKFSGSPTLTVIFEINQTKLSKTNKLIPVSYFDAGISNPYKKDMETRRSVNSFEYEYEEFCIGPIKPLSRYLLSIIVSEKFMNFFDITKDQYRKEMAIVATHPLIKVI